MSDHDDTYYPDPSNETATSHVENQWRPAPRHSESGMRHIRNIRAQLTNAQPAS